MGSKIFSGCDGGRMRSICQYLTIVPPPVNGIRDLGSRPKNDNRTKRGYRLRQETQTLDVFWHNRVTRLTNW